MNRLCHKPQRGMTTPKLPQICTFTRQFTCSLRIRADLIPEISPLFVLILPLIPLHQLLQLPELLNPILFQQSLVHLFASMFEEIHHVSLLIHVFRWGSMINLNKGFHFIIANTPTFILRHRNEYLQFLWQVKLVTIRYRHNLN